MAGKPTFWSKRQKILMSDTRSLSPRSIIAAQRPVLGPAAMPPDRALSPLPPIHDGVTRRSRSRSPRDRRSSSSSSSSSESDDKSSKDHKRRKSASLSKSERKQRKRDKRRAKEERAKEKKRLKKERKVHLLGKCVCVWACWSTVF
jgi:hypothetical protein